MIKAPIVKTFKPEQRFSKNRVIALEESESRWLEIHNKAITKLREQAARIAELEAEIEILQALSLIP
jgi:hypothetical protein